MQKIPKSEVNCIFKKRALIAESPVWCIEKQCLYWVDIEGRNFNEFNPSDNTNLSWNTEERIGSFALCENDTFIVATEFGFKLFDLSTNTLTSILDPEMDKKNNRFNDGRCDRAGRFWAGTMEENGKTTNEASLYRLNTDHECEAMLSGICVSNGLAWSPDNKTMYFADTRKPMVWAFDFDIENGGLSNQRIFIEFGPDDGLPDGAAIDSEGCYWLAQTRAGQICRYTPRGKKDVSIELPIAKPTMCAFGGANLNTLFIATNSFGFSEKDMQEQPLAGALFSIDLSRFGFQGLPEPKFQDQ